MMEILQYQFMRNAIVAAVLVSIACGVVGSYVVTKRIVSISGGISHAAFGGVGLGYLMGVSPVTTAIPFTVGAAISMGAVTRKTGISEDTAIGILWSAGMALGIVFINLSPGYAPDLFSYLFGNILMVTPIDLWTMLILDLIIISSAVLFEREFLALCFDEEYAEVLGVPVDTFYLYLLPSSLSVSLYHKGRWYNTRHSTPHDPCSHCKELQHEHEGHNGQGNPDRCPDGTCRSMDLI